MNCNDQIQVGRIFRKNYRSDIHDFIFEKYDVLDLF